MMQAAGNTFRRHPRATAPPLSLEVRAVFGEPRRMAARTVLNNILRGAQERAPQDDDSN
jgi:hypothetical protein